MTKGDTYMHTGFRGYKDERLNVVRVEVLGIESSEMPLLLDWIVEWTLSLWVRYTEFESQQFLYFTDSSVFHGSENTGQEALHVKT